MSHLQGAVPFPQTYAHNLELYLHILPLVDWCFFFFISVLVTEQMQHVLNDSEMFSLGQLM